jgi:hypothetical protein
MKIDLNNYEAWMMDYLDGNLNDHQSKEMEAFLLKHPHIAEEIEDLNSIELLKDTAEQIPPSFVQGLKKEEIQLHSGIGEENYQEKFMAYHENDLDVSEKSDVLGFLSKNEFLRAEFNTFKNIKLEANLNICYPNKSELLKKERKTVPLWIWSSVAAAMIIIGFWLGNLSNTQRPTYAPSKIDSKLMAQINIDSKNKISIQRDLKTTIDVHQIKQQETIIERTETPSLIASNNSSTIPIQNQDWRKQMDLMQGYAFEKNQLYSKVDWSALPSENSKSGFRIISSMLWKTTKASVQSFGEEIIQNDFPVLSSNNLEDLTRGMISIKRPVKEVE